MHPGRHLGCLRVDQADDRRRAQARDAFVDLAFPLEIRQPLEQREDHQGTVLGSRECGLFQGMGDGHQGSLGQPSHGRILGHGPTMGTPARPRIR
ncbi:hypothetical protein GCM10010435_60510 [Winogradskya consettensis]|uniref:Uncharacterized protein n=1 Tax=Winogradskya consettensis TaxID=113560 RepID=A0A919VUJ8_9ACTN|nr:hypothetical protein [Actinoplanes consettensis]GIM76362.1 hypothetical protein Aco04nite_50050 [Actinoplanes consettensis]